jgi:acyl carrier protein
VDPAALRAELRSFLAEQGIDLSRDVDDSQNLFEAGTLDSLGLFNLVLWIETRTGHPVDPTRLELTREWASVRDILAFVDRRRGAADESG